MNGTPIVATHRIAFIDARSVPDARRRRNDVPRPPAPAGALDDTVVVDTDTVGSDRDDARNPGIDAIRPGDASRRAHRR